MQFTFDQITSKSWTQFQAWRKERKRPIKQVKFNKKVSNLASFQFLQEDNVPYFYSYADIKTYGKIVQRLDREERKKAVQQPNFVDKIVRNGFLKIQTLKKFIKYNDDKAMRAALITDWIGQKSVFQMLEMFRIVKILNSKATYKTAFQLMFKYIWNFRQIGRLERNQDIKEANTKYNVRVMQSTDNTSLIYWCQFVITLPQHGISGHSFLKQRTQNKAYKIGELKKGTKPKSLNDVLFEFIMNENFYFQPIDPKYVQEFVQELNDVIQKSSHTSSNISINQTSKKVKDQNFVVIKPSKKDKMQDKKRQKQQASKQKIVQNQKNIKQNNLKFGFLKEQILDIMRKLQVHFSQMGNRQATQVTQRLYQQLSSGLFINLPKPLLQGDAAQKHQQLTANYIEILEILKITLGNDKFFESDYLKDFGIIIRKVQGYNNQVMHYRQKFLNAKQQTQQWLEQMRKMGKFVQIANLTIGSQFLINLKNIISSNNPVLKKIDMTKALLDQAIAMNQGKTRQLLQTLQSILIQSFQSQITNSINQNQIQYFNTQITRLEQQKRKWDQEKLIQQSQMIGFNEQLQNKISQNRRLEEQAQRNQILIDELNKQKRKHIQQHQKYKQETEYKINQTKKQVQELVVFVDRQKENINNLMREGTNLQSEYTKTNQLNQNLQNEVANLKQRMLEVQNEKSILNQQYQQLYSQSQGNTRQFELLKKRYLELQKSQQQLQNQMQYLTERLNASNKRVNQLEQKLSQIEKKEFNAKQKYENDVQGLKQAVLEAKYANQQKNLYQKKAGQLEQKLQQIEGKIRKLENQNQRIKSQSNKQTKSYLQLEHRVKTTTEQRDGYKKKIDELKYQNQSIRKIYNQYKNQVETKSSKDTDDASDMILKLQTAVTVQNKNYLTQLQKNKALQVRFKTVVERMMDYFFAIFRVQTVNSMQILDQLYDKKRISASQYKQTLTYLVNQFKQSMSRSKQYVTIWGGGVAQDLNQLTAIYDRNRYKYLYNDTIMANTLTSMDDFVRNRQQRFLNVDPHKLNK